MERVRLSALGRDVHVGNLYNYKNNTILQCNSIEGTKEFVRTEKESTPEKRFVYPSQQLTEECRRSMVGINSQLEHTIKQGYLDVNQLWFASYLKASVTERKDDAARVTAFFRVVRNTETIDQECLSKIYDWKTIDTSPFTHLVHQVFYGAEIICSMRKDIKTQVEKKMNVEDSICRAAKIYIDQAIKTGWTKLKQPPAELENISCQTFSSVDIGQQLMTGSFQQFCDWFKKNITLNNNCKFWKPVDIVLHPISASAFRFNTLKGRAFEMERKWHWICNESFNLVTQPGLTKIPLMEKMLCDFSDLLLALRKRIDLFSSSTESTMSTTNSTNELLCDITVWLSRRRRETEELFSLFKDNDLDAYNLTDIEARPLSSCRKRAKIFIVKVHYKQDTLVKKMQELIGIAHANFQWPVFTITVCGTTRRRIFTTALKEFVEDAEWCSNPDNSYQIGLVPNSSSLANGTIKTILFPAMPSLESLSESKIQPNLPPPLVPIILPKSEPKKTDDQVHHIEPEGQSRKKMKCEEGSV